MTHVQHAAREQASRRREEGSRREDKMSVQPGRTLEMNVCFKAGAG